MVIIGKDNHLFGTNPLSEPKGTYLQLDPQEHIPVKF